MEPILSELLLRQATSVRLEVRHAPLPIHRGAWGAALTAECALEQGIFWPFHAALLAGPDRGALPPAALAVSLGADRAELEACLASERPGARVDADQALAGALGVRVAPTFFVNEQRLDGPQTLEALEAAVAAELARGAGRPSTAVPSPAPTPTAPREPPQTATEPGVRLERRALERELVDRDAFAAQTELAPLDVQGHRLVRLARVPPDSLLARMQLEPRDLLMQVDGAWLVDRVDPLCDALLTRDRVRLTIIRRGFPKTLVYEIE